MKLVVNMAHVADFPTGLGTYSQRALAYVAANFDCAVAAPAYVDVPEHAARIVTDDHLAMGKPMKSRVERYMSLARRQLFYARSPLARDAFIYSPTHHGFFNSTDQVITIHDLITLKFPSHFPRQTQFFRHAIPRLLARSRAVFAVSETTRRDIIETYNHPADQVFVVPNSLAGSHAQSVDFFGDRQPFLLVVGAHLPHKNIHELFERARLWRGRYKLKIVGAKDAYGNRLRALAKDLRLDDAVEFLPFVSASELDTLYRAATALLYPSLVEGFGLPPLEALAKGTLPIVSDIPVHREVMGDAALYVALGNEDSWVAAFDALHAGANADALGIARLDTLHRHSEAVVENALVSALLAAKPELASLRRPRNSV